MMVNFYKSKIVLISIFIVPILVIAFALFGIGIINRSKTQPMREEVKPRQSPQSIFSGVNLDVEGFSFTEYTKVGNKFQKIFVISGKRLKTSNPKFGIFRIAIGKVIELEKPKITFYKDDSPISNASANAGSINPLNKGISFYGNTSLITRDGRTLVCNELKWNNEHPSLLAEGDCILKGNGNTIKAEMVKTDIGLNDYKIIHKDKRVLKTIAKMFGGGR